MRPYQPAEALEQGQPKCFGSEVIPLSDVDGVRAALIIDQAEA